jgi:hypothetical protein
VGSCGEAFVAKIAAMMSPVTSVAPNVPQAAYRPAMPALLTRTSRLPSASMTLATTADGGVVGDVEHEHPRLDLCGGLAARARRRSCRFRPCGRQRLSRRAIVSKPLFAPMVSVVVMPSCCPVPG